MEIYTLKVTKEQGELFENWGGYVDTQFSKFYSTKEDVIKNVARIDEDELESSESLLEDYDIINLQVLTDYEVNYEYEMYELDSETVLLIIAVEWEI